MKYYYPAIFRELEGDGVINYAVSAPDFPGFDAIEFSIPGAYASVKLLISARLCAMEDQNSLVPVATNILTISTAPGEFVAIIEADTDVYKAQRELERVNTNVTIPAYLKEMGIEKKINFSQTLEDALKLKLGIGDSGLLGEIRRYRPLTRQNKGSIPGGIRTQRIDEILSPELVEKIELWKDLHIPEELMLTELPHTFKYEKGPFPFFLRFEDDSIIKCVTATDYPGKGKFLSIKKRVSMPHSADHTAEITLTPEFAQEKLNEGFKWCRVAAYDTMW